MPTLLDLFRTLSSFSPTRVDLRKAPWDDYLEWSVSHGLAPLAAYNLEYRLAGANAPEHVRERLLGIYQGLLNDNVMKLVNFKRAIDGLEGRRVALVGAAAFAESLYPHVAFRPVAEIRLLVRPTDVHALGNYLKHAEFKPAENPEGEVLKPELVVSDTRTAILIHGTLTPDPKEDAAMLERAEAVKVYGPSMFRLTREDAMLAQVLMAARAGFDVPFIEWVDMRELVFGTDAVEAILSRAKTWKLERALYAAMQVVTQLFPDAAERAAKLTPELPSATRKALDVSVVAPTVIVGRTTTSSSGEKLRELMLS